MSNIPGTSFPSADDRNMPNAEGGSEASTLNSAVGNPNSGTDLLGRVVQTAHETIDRFAETAAPHVQRLQEGVNSATDVVQARAGDIRETGEEWVETVRTTVRDNPLAALAAAVAIGMLVSRITRR